MRELIGFLNFFTGLSINIFKYCENVLEMFIDLCEVMFAYLKIYGIYLVAGIIV